jgi:hypothetical protein
MTAISQPNINQSIPSATSFTIGEDIRKENVTPSGTPASTKPINIGTAEQLQKGVRIPSNAAIMLPINVRLCPSTSFDFSGGKKLLTTAMMKIMKTSKNKILTES